MIRAPLAASVLRHRRKLLLTAVLLAAAALADADERDVGALGTIATRPGAPPSRTFDYLYVEPNSGASSGGHAAVRFGDVTFHFQHADPGIIRSIKETSGSFEYAYRALGNRTVHASSIAVSADTYERLRDAFEQRHLVQQSQLELLASRRRDRALFEQLRDGTAAPGRAPDFPRDAAVALPGSGYFVIAAAVSGDAEHAEARGVAKHCRAAGGPASAALALLRERVREARGADYLARRSDALRAQIDALAYDDAASRVPVLAPQLVPAARTGFADRYGELLLAWLAVEVMRAGGCVRAETLRTSDDPAFRLSETERDRLRALAARLTDDLLRLLDSRRADVGIPLLVGLARLVAFGRSVASGRLTVLDVFPQQPQQLPPDAVRRYAPALRAILAERRTELAQARAEVSASPASGEATWSRLETATNLVLELESALERGTPLRVHDGTLLPVKAAPWSPTWPRPQLSPPGLDRAAAAAVRIERAAGAQLAALYPYHVVRRNCVTEIFRTIDVALDPARDGAVVGAGAVRVRAQAHDRLGGYVRMTGTANFIPVVAHRAVRHTYRVTARRRLPSYRRQRLARLAERESPLRVYLRESNTLTSTIQPAAYTREPFLFFTEDTVPPRPLFGLVNLGVGAGASALGIVTLSFDRGQRFLAGIRAALFSLPELAFVSLRKGEIPILPRDWRSYDASGDAAAARR